MSERMNISGIIARILLKGESVEQEVKTKQVRLQDKVIASCCLDEEGFANFTVAKHEGPILMLLPEDERVKVKEIIRIAKKRFRKGVVIA